MEKIIITIGRQFGSGGREIGKKLAEKFGISYYDKELLQLAAKESGLCSELFEKADEKTSGSFLQALAMGFSMNGAIYQPNDYFTDATLFQVQSDVIRKLGTEKSCVIVGRCADYILQDEKTVQIFLYIPASLTAYGGFRILCLYLKKKLWNLSAKRIRQEPVITITIQTKPGVQQCPIISALIPLF